MPTWIGFARCPTATCRCACWTIWTAHWTGRRRFAGSLAVEAVVENYPEYIDYNSITTQSDRGDMLYTLLDFLRLRAGYDRVAWNLRPILLIHEVLVQSGQRQAAEIWRKAVAERTGDIADDCLRRLRNMNKKYGMKLPSIAERLEERFIRPLQVDRLCSLVRPAMEELRDGHQIRPSRSWKNWWANSPRKSPGPVLKRPIGSPTWKTRPSRCKPR